MQTCEKCGRELRPDGQTKFCPFCGAPVAHRNAPPHAAAPVPPVPMSPANTPEENNKNQKTLYIVLAVAALALLLIVILLAVKVFGGRESVDPGPDSAVSTVDLLAEKEAAFRKSLSIVDVSGFPQSSSSGCFETFCGDLSGDGAPEYVAIYGDFQEEQPAVDIRLYDMETDEPQETDRLAEPINAVVGGNGALSICAFIENGRLYVFRSFCAFGGSRWGNEYICFSVQNGALKEEYHFKEYAFPRYDQFTYEETVSGATYASPDALNAAVKEKGPAPHSHDMTVDENGAPTEAPTDGHIFVLYHNVNFNETGETGYIRLFLDHSAADAQPAETTAPPVSGKSVSLRDVWPSLEGDYWLEQPDDVYGDKNVCARFYEEDGKLWIAFGWWHSEGGDPVYVKEGSETGDFNGTVFFTAVNPAHYDYWDKKTWKPEQTSSHEMYFSELANGTIRFDEYTFSYRGKPS